MAIDADWGNLLSDILILIAKRLSALDYANFSAVCTSWASVSSPANAMPRPLPLRKNQPFLILFSGDGNNDCEHSDFCTLFDFLDHSLYRVNHLPEIHGKWLVGSQLGWLAVIDEFSNPSLLNPFTRSQIELPKITTVPEVEPIYDPEGSLTSYRFYGEEYSNLEEARPPLGIKKLVLSSNPTTNGGDVGAVAIGPCGILMFTRPGESEWNLLKPYMRHSIVDIIYRDGKFLALSNFGDVYAIDLSCPYYSPEDSLFANRYSDECSGTRYLVDSSGVLLHVYRKNDFVDDEFMYKTYKIEIRSLDPKTGVWIPVTSLGDCSLFVGSWCSMSFSAKEISWLEENYVYFTDDYWDILGSSETKKMARDIGMFNLSNGSFETCYPSEMRLTWPPPIWITSPQIQSKQHHK